MALNKMPIANIRDVHINGQVLGKHGPWVTLSPGGHSDLSAVVSLATQVAAAGSRRYYAGGSLQEPLALR